MTYSVKEIYYTLQGEGANTGRPAVFCRFAGCNLWTGREAHRARALCQFCDTDFVGTNGPGGGKFTRADLLADTVAGKWPAQKRAGKRLVICTGGEPLLQLDTALIEAFHVRGFEVAVETNGTIRAPEGLDWICVSPKAGAPLAMTRGDELKLIFPQPGASPELFESLSFDHFFLQPMDNAQREQNTLTTVEYCLQHPQWRLSMQTHKYLNIR